MQKIPARTFKIIAVVGTTGKGRLHGLIELLAGLLRLAIHHAPMRIIAMPPNCDMGYFSLLFTLLLRRIIGMCGIATLGFIISLFWCGWPLSPVAFSSAQFSRKFRSQYRLYAAAPMAARSTRRISARKVSPSYDGGTRVEVADPIRSAEDVERFQCLCAIFPGLFSCRSPLLAFLVGDVVASFNNSVYGIDIVSDELFTRRASHVVIVSWGLATSAVMPTMARPRTRTFVLSQMCC